MAFRICQHLTIRILVGLLLPSFALAKPTTLFLHADKDVDGYSEATRKIAESASRWRSREIVNLQSNSNRYLTTKSWDELTTESFNKATSGVAKGESILIDVSGPGKPPRVGRGESATDPAVAIRAGVDLGGSKAVTYQDIDAIIEKLPQDQKVKLIVHSDFGGNAHYLAFKHPKRVCVAARTDLSGMNRTTHGERSFGPQLWSAIKDQKSQLDPKVKGSLADAYIRGAGHEPTNFGRTQLSSLAYVDYVMKKGPWAQGGYDETPPLLKTMEKELLDQDKYEADMSAERMRPYCDYDTTIEKLFKDYDALNAEMRLNHFIEPKDLVKLQHHALAVWKVHRERFASDFKSQRDQYAKLEDSYKAMSPAEKEKNLASTVKQMKSLNRNISEIMQRAYQAYLMMKKVKDSQVFMNRATPEQKQNFESLLACEMENL